MRDTRRGVWKFLTERNAFALTVAIFVFLLVQSMLKGLTRSHGNDLTNYLYAAGLFFDGTNPYGIKWGSLYPLFASIVFQPFNFMPVWLAHLSWYLLNFGLLIAALKVAQERVASRSFSWVAFVLVIVPLLDILQSHMLNAQVNILVMACAVGFMLFLKEGREHPAALCLAAAVSIKLVPGVLFLYLLLGRKFGLLFKTVGYIVVMVFVLPYLIAGNEMFEFYGAYVAEVMRKLAPSGGASHAAVSGVMKYKTPVWMLFGVAAISALNIFANRRVGGASVRAVYLYFVLLLFIVPGIFEVHHMVWLFPPLVALVQGLYLGEINSGRQKPLALSVAALFVVYNVARFTPFSYEVYLLSILLAFVLTVVWVFDEAPGGDGVGVRAEL